MPYHVPPIQFGKVYSLTDNVKEYRLTPPLKAGMKVTVQSFDHGFCNVVTEDGVQCRVFMANVDRGYYYDTQVTFLPEAPKDQEYLQPDPRIGESTLERLKRIAALQVHFTDLCANMDVQDSAVSECLDRNCYDVMAVRTGGSSARYYFRCRAKLSR